MVDYYEKVREFVLRVIATRSELHANRVPSIYWTDFAKNFRYVYDLSPAELLRIRYHTYHLTSDSYLTYYFADDAYREILAKGYRFFMEGADLVPMEEGEHGIGVETVHGRISHDLLRYLGVMSDIKHAGLFATTGYDVVLEIGGGYGGLARAHLMQVPDASYVICDLEETIFFSATYLGNLIGADKIHLVDSNLSNEELRPGHVYIVPQSRIELLDGMQANYAISQQSLQEMTLSQVRFYLQWLARHVDYLYSCNIDSHGNLASDKQLVTRLTRLMSDTLGEPIWAGRAPDSGCRFGDNHLPRAVYQCRKQ